MGQRTVQHMKFTRGRLDSLIAFIEDHEWCQRHEASKADGTPCCYDDPYAHSFCVCGAVAKLWGVEKAFWLYRALAVILIEQISPANKMGTLPDRYCSFRRLSEWNDSSRASKPLILQILRARLACMIDPPLVDA